MLQQTDYQMLAICFAGLLVALVASVMAILIARRFAERFGIIDEPDHRKIHTAPTPRVGGIGIIFGFFAGLLIFQIASKTFLSGYPTPILPDIYLLTGAMAIAVAGLVDDLRGLNFRQKLIVQCMVAVYLILAGYRLNLDFGNFTEYAKAISIPVTMLWIIGVTNAINLIDGMDGLAGGLFMISLVIIAICSLIIGAPVNIALLFCAAGAVIGFLLLNWHPAKTFMGDSGSLFLGFIIASLSLQTTANPTGFFVFLVPVLAVGLPVFDTLLSMTRRYLKNRPMFYPDKDHIHHRVEQVFHLGTRRTVYCLYGINVILGLFAIVLTLSGTLMGFAVCLLAGLFYLTLLYRLQYISIIQLKRYLETRRTRKRLYETPLITLGK